jgi:hypothetical protein
MNFSIIIIPIFVSYSIYGTYFSYNMTMYSLIGFNQEGQGMTQIYNPHLIHPLEPTNLDLGSHFR